MSLRFAKIRLTSTLQASCVGHFFAVKLVLRLCMLAFFSVVLIGCDSSPEPPPLVETVDKPKGVEALRYPLKKLVGRWQSECNVRHFGRPVITSIDFRPGFIRWTNHFYFDKVCVRSDEAERMDYVHQYVEDVRILGDVWAHLYRLKPGLISGGDMSDSALEVFQVQDEWLYISTEGSGPEFGAPWDLDSNFGLRRLR